VRFAIDHDKCDRKRPELRALEVLLNEHLIGRDHGPGLDAVFLDLIEAPKPTKKFKKRLFYGKYAQIELPLNVDVEASPHNRFLLAFEAVTQAVHLAAEISLKKGGFHQRRLLDDLEQVRAHLPADGAALDAYIVCCPEIERENILKSVRLGQVVREAMPKPLTTALAGVRIYAQGELRDVDVRAFAFGQVYGNLLGRAGVLTPGYREIYLYVASTLDEALREFALEPWYECAPTALNLAEYTAADESTKLVMLSEAYGAALRDIARIDHLDASKVGEVIEDVSVHGLDRDLVLLSKDAARFRCEVVYNPMRADRKGKVPYRLRLTCLESAREGEQKVADLDPWSAPYSLSAIALTRREVVLTARKSMRADIAIRLAKLPSQFRFDCEEVLAAGVPATHAASSEAPSQWLLPLNPRP